MHKSIFILIYLLNISISQGSYSYAKDYKFQSKTNQIYKKYSSNSLIKKDANYIAKNTDLEDFCKDFSNAKSLQLNLFPPELVYEVYDECLIKGLKWMKKYEKNKSSGKKSIEQIMIEQEEVKRESKERSLQRKNILKERYENNFDDLFR
tara:strand:- start:631 stop:1080 length:450 start_codon:yes stop_codon:yes gene_type:complete